MRYIVIDHAHRLADQDVLAVLLRLRELAGEHLRRISVASLNARPYQDTTNLQAAFKIYHCE